jgi:hypothetical protein
MAAQIFGSTVVKEKDLIAFQKSFREVFSTNTMDLCVISFFMESFVTVFTATAYS